MKYQNPILRGMYPDPSVCRANDRYYLVCSSFQYFPGVPLFESDDMVNWRQIGHCLTSASQLPLEGASTTGGIYAPTIRYHEGRFYMVTTNASLNRNFFVYTDDIYGEWSEPVFVDQDGIDPSLFFENNRCYFISNGADDAGKTCIRMCCIDPETGKKLEETKPLWYGTGGRYQEAPHLYHIGEYYYLIDAEGGTEYGHMVCCARSRRIEGPYEPCPHNPVLTNRNLGGYQLQAAGHGDLLEDKDGHWWFVHLAFRQMDQWQPYHHLGRETCLVPVTWTDDGWFHIGDGTSSLSYDLPEISGQQENRSFHDTFATLALGKDWVFLRRYQPEKYRFGADFLEITASADDLSGLGHPSFAGIRQREFDMQISCRVESACKEAGLSLYMDEKHHYDFYIERNADKTKRLVLRGTIGWLSAETFQAPVGDEPVRLQITATPAAYHFQVFFADGKIMDAGTADTKYLSSEVAAGFTGVMLGLYAIDPNGGSARFTELALDYDDSQR